jgi:D-alanyl-D-alanine carboxypeptidase
MNRNARALRMFNTHYNNSHGLANQYNKSTAQDIAILAANAMKLPVFKEIVGTKEYQCNILTAKGNINTVKWDNTNMMLNFDGFNGLKTGITPSAGPCLCSSYCKDNVELIIVLLNCRSIDKRWSETRKLLAYSLTTIEREKSRTACIMRNHLPPLYNTEKNEENKQDSTNVSSSEL